ARQHSQGVTTAYQWCCCRRRCGSECRNTRHDFGDECVRQSIMQVHERAVKHRIAFREDDDGLAAAEVPRQSLLALRVKISHCAGISAVMVCWPRGHGVL